jgi:hypothetical protein
VAVSDSPETGLVQLWIEAPPSAARVVLWEAAWTRLPEAGRATDPRWKHSDLLRLGRLKIVEARMETDFHQK